jgi:hypothetical protein
VVGNQYIRRDVVLPSKADVLAQQEGGDGHGEDEAQRHRHGQEHWALLLDHPDLQVVRDSRHDDALRRTRSVVVT